MKQTVAKMDVKWSKPSVKTISIQELKCAVSAAACSQYDPGPCLGGFYR